MALQMADPGGEHYFSKGLGAAGQWTSSSGMSLVNNAPVGRTTQYAIIQNSNGGTVQWNMPTNYAHVVVGCAIYVPTNGFTTNTALIRLQDTGTVQVDMRVDALGHITITRNGTLLGTSTNALVNGSGWHYFELDALIDGTVGTAQVWVDGVSWLSLTGQNTKSTGNAFVNQFVLTASTITGNAYFKDIYMLDTGTGNRTSHLGDVAALPQFASGAGTNQQYTPNTGTQTAAVQDGTTHSGTWPDDDTTYISDATSGHISDFTHQALSLTGTIYGVIHQSYVRKDDAGARSFNQVCLSGGTTETSSAIALGNTYTYFFDVLEHDPNTGADWTVSNFNSATFGVKTT